MNPVRYRIRLSAVLLLFTLAGIVAAMMGASSVPGMTRTVRRCFGLKAVPIIEYPRTMDLGEHESGEELVVPFTISNHGDGTLVVDEVRTSCGCTGMEEAIEGRVVTIQSLTVESNETRDVAMRIKVGGAPHGADRTIDVSFRTNDPAEPRGRIQVVLRNIYRAIIANPRSVVF